MLNNVEQIICDATGHFSTIPQIINPSGQYQNYYSDNYGGLYKLPGQCRAFLATNLEFIFFIEAYDVVDGVLGNKKLYPAKVTGLGLPYLLNEMIRWREGLVSSYFFDNNRAFRPGFGQAILSDLLRPLNSVSVQRNHLGLGASAQGNTGAFPCAPLGRLMSMAAIVNKKIASEYDASNSKKKKKSLNSQDYEQTPTYPQYDIYVSGGY
jgi:hypothetical protein